MPSNQQLTVMLDRAIQATQELRANAVALANLESDIKRAQDTLAGLESRIAQGKQLAAEVDAAQEKLKAKRDELAQIDAVLAKKSEQHGTLDGQLRTLMRKAAALTEQS